MSIILINQDVYKLKGDILMKVPYNSINIIRYNLSNDINKYMYSEIQI